MCFLLFLGIYVVNICMVLEMDIPHFDQYDIPN